MKLLHIATHGYNMRLSLVGTASSWGKLSRSKLRGSPVASSETFRLWAEDQLALYRRLLIGYESGRHTQGERLDNGQLVDRTPEAIADCRRIIADLENLLK